MAAIYQWFPSQIYNYEYFIFVSDLDEAMKYYGYDFDEDEYYVHGQYSYTGGTLAGNNKSIYHAAMSGGSPAVYQYIWRGNCFHAIGPQLIPSAYNTPDDIICLREPDQIVSVGSAAYGHGVIATPYSSNDVPTVFLTSHTITTTNDFWGRIFDVFYGQPAADTREWGKAILATGAYTSQVLATMYWNGAAWIVADTHYDANVQSNTIYNRFAGIATGVGGSLVSWVNIDENLIISAGGSFSPSGGVRAAIAAGYGYFLTQEIDSSGTGMYIRCYNSSGTVLDEILIDAAATGLSARSMFSISPRTLRIWAFSATRQIGLRALRVSPTGQITQEGYIPNEGAMNSGGYSANLFYPLEGGMEITSNGFTGIKEKLCEHFSLDETTGTRAGSMGLFDVSESGSVGYTTGKLSNAAAFTGAEALIKTNPPTELQSGADFSFCVDFKLNSIGSTQCIVTKASSTAAYLGGTHMWDYGLYVDATGLPYFWVNERDNPATSFSSTDTCVYGPSALSAGVWYHAYCEWDKVNNTLSIRIDNGVTQSNVLSAETALRINVVNPAFSIGRGTSTSPQGYLDGAVDNLFLFYARLSSSEQDFMYNGGSSRTFAEL